MSIGKTFIHPELGTPHHHHNAEGVIRSHKCGYGGVWRDKRGMEAWGYGVWRGMALISERKRHGSG